MKSKASFLPDFSKKDLFYEMHKRSHYLDNLKKVVDNFKAKQALVDARAENIKRQNMLNYQGEYDKIVQALRHSAIPGVTKEMLRDRRLRLKELGVNSAFVRTMD